MANRNFNRKQALEREIKELYLKCSFDGSGEPVVISDVGIESISREAAGEYLITLQDDYVSLKQVSGIFLAEAAEDIRVQVKEEDVADAKTLSIFTLTAATPTDPAEDTVLLLKIELKNTTAI